MYTPSLRAEGRHLTQRTSRAYRNNLQRLQRLVGTICVLPLVHCRSPVSSRNEPAHGDGTLIVVATALDRLAPGARLPRRGHYVEPRAHNGKRSVTGPTQLKVEMQPLRRPRIPVTAPTHLSSQLWPRGHTSGSPPQSPLETEKPAGAPVSAPSALLRSPRKNPGHIRQPSIRGCRPESLDLVASGPC